MPDPPTYANALHQIRNTFSSQRLDSQAEYLHQHESSYTRVELDALLSAIEEQRRKINPAPTEYNCARIKEIEVTYTPEGNAFLITPRSKTHNLLKYCELADRAGLNLTEYIEHEHSPVYDIRYEFQRPTASMMGLREQENELYTELNTPMHQPVEKSKKEANVSIDVMDIFNRMQRSIDERFNELERLISRGAPTSDVNALRERIDALERERNAFQSKYNDLLTQTEKNQTEKEYTATLTAKEYGIFQKLYREYLPGLRPWTYHESGEGYSIRITYENADQERAIQDLIRKVHTEGKPSERRVNPLSNSHLVDTLCSVYESETGKPCGVSRYGALTALAQRILDYVDEFNRRHPGRHELDLQELDRYIQEIDLFARPGQSVYTAEQVDEAFTAFVRNVESQIGESNVRKTSISTPDLCAPEVMYPAFVDVYVYLEKQANGTLTEADKKAYARALDVLKPCGYSPARYGEFLEGAVSFYDSMGQDFYRIAEGS